MNVDAPSPECYCTCESSTQDRDRPLSSQEPALEFSQSDTDGELDKVHSMVSVDHTKSDYNASEDEDVTIVATQEGNVVQCSTQVHDYYFHSPALSHLLVWDFVSQVDKVKKPDGSCCVNSDVEQVVVYSIYYTTVL